MKTNKRLATSTFCKNIIKYFVLVELLQIQLHHKKKKKKKLTKEIKSKLLIIPKQSNVINHLNLCFYFCFCFKC